MKGLFCGEKIATNEEYRKVEERKSIIFVGLFFLGIITIVFALLARNVWKIPNVGEYMYGVYTGFGSGLASVSAILFIKSRRILKSEEKLKEARIQNTDERNIQINSKAIRIALFAMLIAMYVLMLIGGLWNPILTKTLLMLICGFLLVYLIAYKVISKNM